jgi:hypothetical protein
LEPDETLNDYDWMTLLKAIQNGKCTPFLGAGVCHGYVPLAAEIAEAWAARFAYPLDDRKDLARVAQYLATESNSAFTKDELQELFATYSPPDFHQPDEPHGVLADLNLPLYITTNYDDFMEQALTNRGRESQSEICPWHEALRPKLSRQKGRAASARAKGSPSLLADLNPTPEKPVVYHLHGVASRPESVVLTEDDYVDFLVSIGKEDLLPPQIEKAMTSTSLLFLGYRLADWNFRVLFRGLVYFIAKNYRRSHVSVQLVPVQPTAEAEQMLRAKEYLKRYFDKLDVRVYWGTCREFMTDLKARL